MEDKLAAELITKLQPMFYTIGFVVVFIMVTFGGAIFSFWWRTRERQSSKLEEKLADLEQLGEQHTLALVRIETKLSLTTEQHEKDLNGLGNKIRKLKSKGEGSALP